MFGVPPDVVSQMVENVLLSSSALPEDMRFTFVQATQIAEIETRSYRQEKDHNIYAILSLRDEAVPRQDSVTAILSFTIPLE